jgi:dolichol-phosphate mannosyltransferase
LNVEEPNLPESGLRGFAQSVRNLIRKQKTFIKFALVGASGVLVNEGVYYILTRYAGLPYIPSQAVGIELAIINNFTWNDSFTFKGALPHNKSKRARFIRYNLLSLVTFTLNLVIFAILLSLHVWDIYASLLAIIASFGLNYLGSSKWAWRGANSEEKEEFSP